MVILAFTMLATPEELLPVPELNALISPVNMALTATPTRMMRRGDSPPFQEREYTSKNAIIPPKNANRGVKKYNAGKNAVISTATRLAPELIPIIPGSASGFFNTAWNNTPETAMAAPANIEMMIRGKRRS